jgi:hypothetical protein
MMTVTVDHNIDANEHHWDEERRWIIIITPMSITASGMRKEGQIPEYHIFGQPWAPQLALT